MTFQVCLDLQSGLDNVHKLLVSLQRITIGLSDCTFLALLDFVVVMLQCSQIQTINLMSTSDKKYLSFITRHINHPRQRLERLEMLFDDEHALGPIRMPLFIIIFSTLKVKDLFYSSVILNAGLRKSTPSI